MRILKYPINDVVRPLMIEIVAIAKAAGYVFPENIVESTIHVDPEDTYFKPSMQQDIEKVFSSITTLMNKKCCGRQANCECVGKLHGV